MSCPPCYKDLLHAVNLFLDVMRGILPPTFAVQHMGCKKLANLDPDWLGLVTTRSLYHSIYRLQGSIRSRESKVSLFILLHSMVITVVLLCKLLLVTCEIRIFATVDFKIWNWWTCYSHVSSILHTYHEVWSQTKRSSFLYVGVGWFSEDGRPNSSRPIESKTTFHAWRML